MANPQPDKFTRISNELLEKFLMVGIKMKPSAIAVWLAIARKTYGYHKKKDRISLSQLAEMTDLERRSVCRALKQLKSFNMIIDDNGLRGIQKDYELWQIGTKRSVTKRSDDQLATIGSDQTATNGDKSSDQLVHLVVTKQPHTKESIKERVNIKKEEKESSPPGHKEAVSYFCDQYQKRLGIPYNFKGAKDGRHIKELLKTFQLEGLKALIDQLFETTDEFVRNRAGQDIGVLYACSNKLARQVVAKKRGLDKFSSATLTTLQNMAKVFNDRETAKNRQDT